jgi:hypothetical protein
MSSIVLEFEKNMEMEEEEKRAIEKKKQKKRTANEWNERARLCAAAFFLFLIPSRFID